MRTCLLLAFVTHASAQRTYPMSCGPQLGQDAVQQIKLARHAIQKLIADLVRINDSLHLLKHKGVVTDLSQLHDCIIQALDASFSANFVSINRVSLL